MTLRSTVKEIDRLVGSPLASLLRGYKGTMSTLREERATRADYVRFQVERYKRRQKYKKVGLNFSLRPEVVESLNADGFAVLRGVVEKDSLARLRQEFEQCLDSGRHLNPISRDSARAAGDREGPRSFLDKEEMARGQQYYRQHANFVSAADPLVNCPSAVGLSLGELLIDIAAGYLKCAPSLSSVNLRKSFVNDLSEFDTLYFHSDGNSPKFIKFFFYLNDVDEGGGPFCYVRGSNRKKFRGWTSKYRWSFEEIAAVYGEERVVNLTGQVGDLIMADTTGFHRGTKVRTQDRSMLTVNYAAHPEYWGTHPRFKIASKDLVQLSARQKAALDFLEII